MAPGREHEEDEQPVAERSGAGVEEATGGHVLPIEAMMELINGLQEMIVVKENAHEMKSEFTTNPSSFLYAEDSPTLSRPSVPDDIPTTSTGFVKGCLKIGSTKGPCCLF